jgi:hypothetical protein
MRKKVRSGRYEYFWRPLRIFLAAAMNVFGGRYEPEKSGIHPTDIRPFSLFEPTFLPACSDYGLTPFLISNTNCHELNMNYPKILIHEKFVFNLWAFVLKKLFLGNELT